MGYSELCTKSTKQIIYLSNLIMEEAKPIKEFEAKLGLKFNDPNILEQSLTHRSYVNENRSEETIHNERNEFLGDAVLELIISEYLFKTYPDNPEGELTSFRAAVVRTEALAEVSRELDVGNYLRMSNGEEATGGRDKDYLLANAFEAILGAIYLDLGWDESVKFVHDHLVPKIERVVKYRLDIDNKTKFQEVAQSLYKLTPTYELISSEGPDHEKTFKMAVLVGDKKFGEGTGSSKQKAEEEAAEKALKKIEKSKTTATIA